MLLGFGKLRSHRSDQTHQNFGIAHVWVRRQRLCRSGLRLIPLLLIEKRASLLKSSQRLSCLVRGRGKATKYADREHPRGLHDVRKTLAQMRPLPEQFQSKLDDASILGTRNLTKRRIGLSRIRIVEIHLVEDVKHL